MANSGGLGFPREQRSNLCDGLRTSLTQLVEDDEETFDQAFAQIALTTLGYDPEAGTTSDGRGDFGIDHWLVEERSATVFQFKSHDFTSRFDCSAQFGPDCLTDVPRIHSFLTNLDSLPPEANTKVTEFAKDVRAAIQRLTVIDHPHEVDFSITVYVCCLAESLTSQAVTEYDRLRAFNSFEYAGRRVSVEHELIMIDDLLAERWREANVDWRTKAGVRDDRITLNVSGQIIDSAKSCVFFARAFDLIEAFDQFGYQIFEPNVRCELKRSRVNEAIRGSINSSRGRREFKHLNNGLTLICASFQKVNNKGSFRISVRQPGVINGLQTVKSIHDAYNDLDQRGKAEFVDKCEVLIRLHTRDAVHDYRELVKSTNNQNPMQPRNLRSNDPEQLNFERLFAELNWFYERKEGAWQAFKSDSSLWGTLKGKRVSDFRAKSNGEDRRIDNLDMSQAWLSFLGFSDQAIHNKRDIFTDERYYNAVFTSRLAKHGSQYNYGFLDEAVRLEAGDQAPSPQLLLYSVLLREVADQLTPSRRQNRDDGIKRLHLENLRKEEQDAKLADDPVYIKGLVLAGAKYLFADFVGHILFKAIGRRVHDIGPELLGMASVSAIADERDFSLLEGIIAREQFSSDDLVPIFWALYNSCLENMIAMSAWRQQFEQAAVRSRFNYSEFNRNQLFQEVNNLDKVYSMRAVPRPWSELFEQERGIYSAVKSVFSNGRARVA